MKKVGILTLAFLLFGVSSVFADINDRLWELNPSLLSARDQFAGGVIDGKIYLFGATPSTDGSEVEVYNPSTNTWRIETSMPKRILTMST